MTVTSTGLNYWVTQSRKQSSKVCAARLMPSTGCHVAADYHMLHCIITFLWLYLQTEWVLKDLFFLHDDDVCILCWPLFCGIKGSKLRCCFWSGTVNILCFCRGITFHLYYICIIKEQIIVGVSNNSCYELRTYSRYTFYLYWIYIA